MKPERLTDEQLAERLSSNNLVIIDFFCLRDEYQNLVLTEREERDQQFYDAIGRNYGEQYSNPNDTSRW